MTINPWDAGEWSPPTLDELRNPDCPEKVLADALTILTSIPWARVGPDTEYDREAIKLILEHANTPTKLKEMHAGRRMNSSRLATLAGRDVRAVPVAPRTSCPLQGEHHGKQEEE